MKNSPRPLFLLRQTLQLALCIGAGSVVLSSAKHRFLHRTARWRSVIHNSRENVSGVPLSPIAANLTPLQPMLGMAHGDLRLVCDC